MLLYDEIRCMACLNLQVLKADSAARRSQSMGSAALQGALAQKLKKLDTFDGHHEASLDHLVCLKAGFKQAGLPHPQSCQSGLAIIPR